MTRRRSLLGILCTLVVVVGVLTWTRPEPSLYRVTILPSIGDVNTEACSLNDLGQVVAVEDTGEEVRRLFLWDRQSGVQDLGPVTSDPVMIDNSGRIGGMMPDPNGPRAFIWRPGKGRTVLDILGGVHSVASAMNNLGQVVGLAYNAKGLARTFVWDEEGKVIRELMPPDGGRYWPASINDKGDVLAMSIRVPADYWQWFLVSVDKTVAIDGVPPSVEFRSVSNDACIVGIDESPGTDFRLVLRQGQGPLRCVASVSIDASVTRLNDKGQIAYTTFRTRTSQKDGQGNDDEEAVSCLLDPVRGCVPLAGYVRDLKSLVVEDLNNKGVILGTGEMKDGTTRPVLLEPIPERWRK
jgi:uncharacterized membrane protein